MALNPKHISLAGRQVLAGAVSRDHDWDLPHSGLDNLIAALSGISTDDLEAAAILADRLGESITCVLIRRDMEADTVKRGQQNSAAPPF